MRQARRVPPGLRHFTPAQWRAWWTLRGSNSDKPLLPPLLPRPRQLLAPGVTTQGFLSNFRQTSAILAAAFSAAAFSVARSYQLPPSPSETRHLIDHETMVQETSKIFHVCVCKRQSAAAVSAAILSASAFSAAAFCAAILSAADLSAATLSATAFSAAILSRLQHDHPACPPRSKVIPAAPSAPPAACVAVVDPRAIASMVHVPVKRKKDETSSVQGLTPCTARLSRLLRARFNALHGSPPENPPCAVAPARFGF
jgi:uncharacterized protein YjbI with pentapeptide repeats